MNKLHLSFIGVFSILMLLSAGNAYAVSVAGSWGYFDLTMMSVSYTDSTGNPVGSFNYKGPGTQSHISGSSAAYNSTTSTYPFTAVDSDNAAGYSDLVVNANLYDSYANAIGYFETYIDTSEDEISAFAESSVRYNNEYDSVTSISNSQVAFMFIAPTTGTLTVTLDYYTDILIETDYADETAKAIINTTVEVGSADTKAFSQQSFLLEKHEYDDGDAGDSNGAVGKARWEDNNSVTFSWDYTQDEYGYFYLVMNSETEAHPTNQNPAAVPEPASMSLMAIGLLSMLGIIKRRA